MTTREACSLGLLLLTVVVGLGRSDAETPEKAFWTWFVKNEVRLAGALKSDPAATIGEINGHLPAEKGVIAEAAIAKEAGAKHMLVISADGLIQYFDAVKALVSAAPALQRWQVLAFRQRRVEGQLEIAGKTFDVSDFSFRERGRKNGKVDLQIPLDDMGSQHGSGTASAAASRSSGPRAGLPTPGSGSSSPRATPMPFSAAASLRCTRGPTPEQARGWST